MRRWPWFEHRRRAFRAVTLAAVPLAALCGCSDPAPAPDAPPTIVKTQVAAPVAVTSSVVITGEIRARVEADLGFRFSGQIASRNADVGDHVQEGEVLATLDSTQQTADLAGAAANVQSAEAQLTQAAATLERQQALLVKGFTTKSAFDDADVQRQSAQATLDSARANLAAAQERLANTELRADGAGIVTARNAEVGQVVAAAQAVYTVAQDGPRDAVFEVYESLLARPPEREGVAITLLSNRAVTAVGALREIAPAIDRTTGTVRVKFAVERTPAEMQLGAAVEGVGEFRKRSVFVLPWTAFFVAGGKPAVWVVDPQTKATTPRHVTVDSFRTRELLVSGGIEPGDIVVTAGIQLLRPGQIVAPQPAGEPASKPADAGS